MSQIEHFQTVYPTFLRTSPPYSNEARVFLQLLHELQYREVVVVHVKADVNALQFIAVFEKDRSDFKIHVYNPTQFRSFVSAFIFVYPRYASNHNY